MLQIDAVSDKGERLDGYNFITMAPNSIGTDYLCASTARGSAAATRAVAALATLPAASTAIRWTTPARSRRTTSPAPSGGMTSSSRNRKAPPRSWLPVGSASAAPAGTRRPPPREQTRPGGATAGQERPGSRAGQPGPAGTFGLRWEFTPLSGKKTTWDSPPRQVQAGCRAAIAIPYVLEETCPGLTPSIAAG